MGSYIGVRGGLVGGVLELLLEEVYVLNTRALTRLRVTQRLEIGRHVILERAERLVLQPLLAERGLELGAA